ncbi:MAG TPA: hypothetical protein ENO18_00410 [Caldithrix sp.]|nr:hypothetical protein [Caldithrix sp.]
MEKVDAYIKSKVDATIEDELTEEEQEEWDEQIQQNRVVGKDKTDLKFGNFSTALKWQYIFNPKLFSEFVIAKSRFRVNMFGEYSEDGDDENLEAFDIINDYTVTGNMTWYYSDHHEVEFGLDYQHLDFNITMDINDISLIDYSRKANFYSAYIQDNWNISERFNAQGGVRMTYYNLGKYTRFDPRISLRYRLKKNINVKTAYGHYHQYFYTFNPEDIDFLNYLRLIDLWFPIDTRYKPIKAIHYIAGLEYMPGDDYLFSIEGYYKDYDNLLDLNELGDRGEKDDFLRGYGKAYGVELMIRKQKGQLTGWLGYSLAFAEKTIELPRASYFIDNRNVKREFQKYNPSYDRRHSLTFVANYKTADQWQLSTRISYASGLPETPTIGWQEFYSIGDNPNEVTGELTPVKAEKNSERYPDYFRWDISLMKTYRYKSFLIQPYLQIINLTNHENIFIYNYNLQNEVDSHGKFRTAKREGVTMFPLIPTVGINFKF